MSDFTHFNEQGRAKMVDVGEKPLSRRTAVAAGRVLVSENTFALIRSGGMKKGDVLTVAQIAGVMGAKRTPDLIPMCHPILMDGINLELSLDEERCSVEIRATVSCDGRTGVEMEALTAVSAAALLSFAAAVLHIWWPVSKLQSTLPWCLYVSAISIVLYVMLRGLESRGKTGWFRPLKASGTATLTVYMIPYILYSFRTMLGITAPDWVSGPVGLLKCAIFSFLCVALASLLVRFKIKLKI